MPEDSRSPRSIVKSMTVGECERPVCSPGLRLTVGAVANELSLPWYGPLPGAPCSVGESPRAADRGDREPATAQARPALHHVDRGARFLCKALWNKFTSKAATDAESATINPAILPFQPTIRPGRTSKSPNFAKSCHRACGLGSCAGDGVGRTAANAAKPRRMGSAVVFSTRANSGSRTSRRAVWQSVAAASVTPRSSIEASCHMGALS